MVGMSKEGIVPTLSCVQSPFVQRARVWMYLAPKLSQEEPLFCHHVFRFTCIKLSESPLLGDADLLGDQGTWNLVLQMAPITGSLFCTLCGWTLRLGQCGPWPLPWGFPKKAGMHVWSLHWGQHASCECALERVFQGPLGQHLQATGCGTLGEAVVCSRCTRGPLWGKEHSRLNWRQRILPFL